MDSIYADMKHSEIKVAYYLKELGLHWIYESPVFVHDEKNRPRVWTPAFYIPKLGMYIEVCGWGKHINYEYKQKIYRKNGFYVIFVHFYKERKNWKRRKWKNYLVKKIKEIEELRHSEVMKMVDSITKDFTTIHDSNTAGSHSL